MASGYVIAAFLEGAGLIGLVIAAFKIRAERRARAAELRSFLRSGQIPPVGTATTGARRVVTMPVPLSRNRRVEGRESSARSALSRAIARGRASSGPDFATPVSAG